MLRRGDMRSALALLTSALLGGTLLPLASAQALPAQVPQVGDCYDLSDETLVAGGWWGDAPAVPCTQAHTFQVTETGILPQDVNAFEFAARQCGPLDVWTEVGVNMPAAGVVADPIRIQATSFAVRTPPASYVCGAVAITLNGSDAPTAISLTSPIERLTRRQERALRYCGSAADGRRALAPQQTVPCSTRPRWQVTAWVMWTAFYDEYPGRTVLRARAKQVCGSGTRVSVPSRAAWEDGLPRTWCYRLYP
jgi:hypothetical protein